MLILFVIIWRVGCLNGGAQIRPEAGVGSREHIQQLEELYHSLPRSSPDTDATVKSIYGAHMDGMYSDKARSMLHTSYHAVEKMNTALNIKW